MELGGGEQGCKQVETVPVMAISIPLGQAQLWMKNGVTGKRKLAEEQEAERQMRAKLIVKGTTNLLQKLPPKQSNPSVKVGGMVSV